MDLLGDMLRPSLRQDDFDTEKQVILEEIQMYEDQPPFGADEKCRAAYFGPHPLGHSVLGTTRASPNCRSSRCAPISSGATARTTSSWRRPDASTSTALSPTRRGLAAIGSAAQLPPRRAGRAASRLSHASQGVGHAAVRHATGRGPGRADTDRYAAKLLTVVLGDDSGSRLYWELVDSGLAEHCELNHHEYEAAGVFFTYMSCAPELTAENLQRIAKVYREAAADGIASDELNQAKSKVRSRMVLSSERPRGRLFSIGSDWVYRREYRSVKEELDTVAAVGVDQLAAALDKYRLDCNMTITVGPLDVVPAAK